MTYSLRTKTTNCTKKNCCLFNIYIRSNYLDDDLIVGSSISALLLNMFMDGQLNNTLFTTMQKNEILMF